ncbi:hypothetical protein MNBD_GAMMA13-912 [hydrothermal vent metagenome]|uniref:GGDEF domain-containing protein n=1 Tax=hydrothermal vent metagenome TaxID=652676 RepID=A0A3B0ZIG0_9ZZZZ
MRYADGSGWPRLLGKTGEFSAGLVATRTGFRATHWQRGVSFAVCSGWTWRKRAFILPILFAASGVLGSAVKEGIDGIQNSMRDTTDLDQIKQLVQSHIDIVLDHMEKHHATEQQRYDAAKAEISRVTERLHDVESEADALRARAHEERNQAQTDVLTGIPNRLAWEERLEQEIARWKRFSTPLVLLIWDVDKFKRVNDTFGHKAGDKVLRTIARSLAAPIHETDFIARYDGEEFVHLMTGAELDACLVVEDKLRSKIESTGFHFRDGDSAESWFERADRALYKAKQKGRNCCISG